jgi:hypothetical protein
VRLYICSFIVLAVALVSCNRNNSAGVEVDSKLRGYILPKSKVLAGVDLDKIKQTDFFKRHQTQLALPQLNELPQEIGMDPRRDLSTFLFAWNGTDAIVMTRGNYSSDQLEKRLSSMGQAEKYNKFTLYGDGKRDVVFLPKGIALVGSAPLLKKAMNDDATGSGEIPEDLQPQLAHVPKTAQVWEVSSGVIPLAGMPIRNDTASLLSNIAGYIDGSAVGITLTTGVALDAHISCISEEGATRVHDALLGVIGFARLSTRDNELDQLKIWDSIKVDKQAKEVHVTADLPAELADKVIALMPSVLKRN